MGRRGVEIRRRMRINHLRSAYGLSEADHKEMVDRAGGKCEICQETPQAHLSIDHNHATGKVRGLLCRRCNNGLGGFRDNIQRLEAAIQYLLNRD